MTQRERFEAWAKKHWRIGTLMLERCRVLHDEYSEPEIQDAWEAWQAACPEGWVAAPPTVTKEMIQAAEDGYMPFADMGFAIHCALVNAPQKGNEKNGN